MLKRLLDTLGLGEVGIPQSLWDLALNELTFVRRLAGTADPEFRRLCGRLLATKVMTGAGGLQLTAPIQINLAVQACLPIQHLGIDWYRGWSGIVVYPSEFRADRRVQDESGLVHEFSETVAGESWDGGPVIVSWPDADHGSGAPEFAFNVVIHEFAHKLDLLNGEADGLPHLDRRLHAGLDPGRWRQILDEAFDRFNAALDLIELQLPDHVDPESSAADAYYARLPLDPYAAQDTAEFFAVSSEAFFVEPSRLREAFPAWYGLLSDFYRQDPLAG